MWGSEVCVGKLWTLGQNIGRRTSYVGVSGGLLEITHVTLETMIGWITYLKKLPEFNERLKAALATLRVTERVKDLVIDHACIRPSSIESAERVLSEVATESQIISSEQINGRPIHIVELNEPLIILGQEVCGLEIPYPKVNQASNDAKDCLAGDYPEDWEHIEFVLPEGTENTRTGLETAFFTLFPHLEKDTLEKNFHFDFSEPAADADQLPNPHLKLKVNGVGLKFHTKPIQKVVGFM